MPPRKAPAVYLAKKLREAVVGDLAEDLRTLPHNGGGLMRFAGFGGNSADFAFAASVLLPSLLLLACGFVKSLGGDCLVGVEKSPRQGPLTFGGSRQHGRIVLTSQRGVPGLAEAQSGFSATTGPLSSTPALLLCRQLRVTGAKFVNPTIWLCWRWAQPSAGQLRVTRNDCAEGIPLH